MKLTDLPVPDSLAQPTEKNGSPQARMNQAENLYPNPTRLMMQMMGG